MQLFILVFYLLSVTVNSICYYPDGSVAPQDTPCQDASAESTCCGQGYACLSNNICMATGDEIQKSEASMYVRGSCTDKAWRSSSCPLFCINPKAPSNDLIAGGMGIEKCSNTTDDMYYCIDGNMDNVDCDKKLNVLSFKGAPTTVTTIGVAPSTTPSITSTTPLTSSFIESQPKVSTTLAWSTQGSSTQSVSTPSSQPTQPPAQASGSSSTVAIAVGVSVGVLVVVIIILAILFFRRKRKAQSSQNTHPLSYQESDQRNQAQWVTHDGPYKQVTQIELSTSPISRDRIHEVPAIDVVHELPSQS
ncbi:hypothetical protein F4779DRAFT_610077 [Xylariaceae sp. FL0662B]|nr:hypothetical protein F4779DRAFT_610077 [Xylariaceae sp. FL0662B]